MTRDEWKKKLSDQFDEHVRERLGKEVDLSPNSVLTQIKNIMTDMHMDKIDAICWASGIDMYDTENGIKYIDWNRLPTDFSPDSFNWLGKRE